MKIVSLILAATLPLASLPAMAYEGDTAAINSKIAAENAESYADIALLEAAVLSVKSGQLAQDYVGMRAEENATGVQRGVRAVFTAGGGFLSAYVANKLIQMGKNRVLALIPDPSVYTNWVAANKINNQRVVDAKEALEVAKKSPDASAVATAQANLKTAEENVAKALSTQPANEEEIKLAQSGVDTAREGLTTAEKTTDTVAIQNAEKYYGEAVLTLAHQSAKPFKYVPMAARGATKLVAIAGIGASYIVITSTSIQFNIDVDYVQAHLDDLQAKIDQKRSELVASGDLN